MLLPPGSDLDQMNVCIGYGMRFGYGEMFKKLGVPGMGFQGATWCGFNADGVLVMMSHETFYRKLGDNWFYIGLGHKNLPSASPSAKRSIKMIEEYFAEGKEIILAVGTFKSDGRYTADGKVVASEFRDASGRAAKAKMLYFDASTGTIACEVMDYFDA